MTLIIVVTLIFGHLAKSDYQATNSYEITYQFRDSDIDQKEEGLFIACQEHSQSLKQYYKSVRGVSKIETRCEYEM